jgi:very-short-patch-repair endonuclease
VSDDPYLREAARACELFIEWTAEKLAAKCESPIEVGLLKGFIALHLVNRTFTIGGMTFRAPIVTEYEATVFIQHEIGDYRADFAVCLAGICGGKHRTAWIAVECDGHEFHERTKAQAARDKARDRAITQAGFRILRFTGSEIYRSSFACAVEVHNLVNKIIEEWEADVAN